VAQLAQAELEADSNHKLSITRNRDWARYNLNERLAGEELCWVARGRRMRRLFAVAIGDELGWKSH